MKLIIATCDKTSWILKAFEFLMDRYCPEITDIYVLGYSKFPELSEKYHCISLSSEQKSINEWCGNLHDYISKMDEEYVTFGLEDLLPIKPINYDILSSGFNLMSDDKSIVRYELGTGHCWHKWTKEVYSEPEYSFYKYGKDSLYRISTQWAIWNREYLLSYLKHGWSAWNFKIEGSKIAATDGKNVIASSGQYAWEWVHSALSGKYPDMVNVQGIDRTYVEEMIVLGILERDKLQLGIELTSPKYL